MCEGRIRGLTDGLDVVFRNKKEERDDSGFFGLSYWDKSTINWDIKIKTGELTGMKGKIWRLVLNIVSLKCIHENGSREFG